MHKDKATKMAQLVTSNKMMATQQRPKGGDLSKSKVIGGGSGDIKVKKYE